MPEVDRKYPLPMVLFECKGGDDHTCAADELFWYPKGWHCRHCADELELKPQSYTDGTPLPSVSLSAHLAAWGKKPYEVYYIKSRPRLVNPVSGTALPAINFACAVDGCREAVVYDADMLYWWNGNDRYKPGFYCEYCDAYEDKELEPLPPGEWHHAQGISLREVLEERLVLAE